LSRLHIATSGFSYKDWLGNFYPGNLSPSQMLAYYSSHFDALELNVSYYTIPAQSSFAAMGSRVPGDFRFMVKVHREVTHNRNHPHESMRQLIHNTQPLAGQGRLAGFLAQFPFGFRNNFNNRRYLSNLKEMCEDIPLFIEFRHVSWAHPAVARYLSETGLGYVNVDEPDLKDLMPPQSLVTNGTAYIRFHGRNRESWWTGQGAQRYDYLYSEKELEAWLIQIKDILKKADRAYVFFNNHPGGKAPKNAMWLKKMVKKM